MKASDVTTLSVRAGAHNLQNSANEAGVQNVNVKLVVKNKKFSMSTLVNIFQLFKRKVITYLSF